MTMFSCLVELVLQVNSRVFNPRLATTYRNNAVDASVHRPVDQQGVSWVGQVGRDNGGHVGNNEHVAG